MFGSTSDARITRTSVLTFRRWRSSRLCFRRISVPLAPLGKPPICSRDVRRREGIFQYLLTIDARSSSRRCGRRTRLRASGAFAEFLPGPASRLESAPRSRRSDGFSSRIGRAASPVSFVASPQVHRRDAEMEAPVGLSRRTSASLQSLCTPAHRHESGLQNSRELAGFGSSWYGGAW